MSSISGPKLIVITIIAGLFLLIAVVGWLFISANDSFTIMYTNEDVVASPIVLNVTSDTLCIKNISHTTFYRYQIICWYGKTERRSPATDMPPIASAAERCFSLSVWPMTKNEGQSDADGTRIGLSHALPDRVDFIANIYKKKLSECSFRLKGNEYVCVSSTRFKEFLDLDSTEYRLTIEK